MSPPQLRRLPGERTLTYSPMGLRLVDDLTGQAPLGRLRFELHASDGTGGWTKTDVKAVVTPSAVVTFPSLGRVGDVTRPPRIYRFHVSAEFYRPEYPDPINPQNPPSLDHYEFQADPYNDSNEPQNRITGPGDLILIPKPNYPFPAGVPVLRGRVLTPTGEPYRDAEVRRGPTHNAYSDERGEFALTLLHVPPNTPTPIDVEHKATNQQKTVQVTLPADLASSFDITLP